MLISKLLKTRSFKKTYLYHFIVFIGECSLLTAGVFKRLFKQPFERSEIIQSMAFVGSSSVPIIILTTFASGAVLALYSAQVLMRYGAGSLTGGMVALSISREISPVLVGIMVTARCGSAMTAQIGTMAVTEQIDALRSLNVHPINYLVIPRLLACVLMLPILSIVGLFSGVLGGYLVATAHGISHHGFIDSIQLFTVPQDFIWGMIKTILFGFIIAIVSCQQGLRVWQGALGVGRSTTSSVVSSMVLIYIADYFLTSLFYR